jgi:cyclomaltodextrinase / maltogenic alpha-amylase / neopullulanase
MSRPAFLLLALLALNSPVKADPKPSSPWAAETVFYQIFPERFRNGDPDNDPPREYLEFPVRPGEDWKISSWTADWYARDNWEKALGRDFYHDGVFDRRYGGDLQGVLDKLDYLSDLGINAIYFNPVFCSHSLHKYDGDSFHHIDPYFGPDPSGDWKLIASETADPETWKWTAADRLFLKLVKQCHERGIRVIIDGVFNHTGRDFFAFKDIRINQQRSRYRDWYVIDSFDDPQTKRNEFSYKGWWGYNRLPVFASTADGKDMHPGPKGYIFAITRRWMQPHGKPADGIDGWRLDVAEERPAKFWADWNAHVRHLNPAAYTTAEIWKNAAQLLKEGGFSASMNYNAFAIPVKGFLIDNNIAPSRFAELIDERRNEFPASNAAVMQNLIDSHDTDRLASMIVNGEGTTYKNPDQIEFNDNNDARSSQTYDIRKPNERERKIQRLVVMFQMCYLGAPMVYYGDEAGMWGGHDPDDRMPMVWADLKYDPQAIDPRGRERTEDDNNFDADLFAFYKKVIDFRRQQHALNHGDFDIVKADDDQRCLVIRRHSEKGTVLVAFNRSEVDATLVLPRVRKPEIAFVSSGEPEVVNMSEGTDGLRITVPSLTGVALTAAP